MHLGSGWRCPARRDVGTHTSANPILLRAIVGRVGGTQGRPLFEQVALTSGLLLPSVFVLIEAIRTTRTMDPCGHISKLTSRYGVLPSLPLLIISFVLFISNPR